LKDSQDARVRLIATDGVFSMDGSIAKLEGHLRSGRALRGAGDGRRLARHRLHRRAGRGTHELRGVMDRVDIMTGTLGKALGGASGGYVAARKEIVGWLRQRSRPYLFSNSIAPPVAAARSRCSICSRDSPELRERCTRMRAISARRCRPRLRFDARRASHHSHHAGRAPLAVRLAERMQEEGVYVVAFSFRSYRTAKRESAPS
jgi:glycine C-acetyltransferase